MSVQPVMEDVVVTVLTLLVAIIVLVPLAVHWTQTIMPVMVSSIVLMIGSSLAAFLDNNECSAGTDNCQQNCHNTGNCGGFYCSCNTGYTLDSNGYTCNGQQYE